MNSIIEKMNRGLAERQRGHQNPFASASSLVVSAASLQSLREEFEAHRTAHGKHVAAAQDRIAKFDAQQAKALADYEYRSIIDNRGEVSKQRRPAGDLAGFREQQKRERIACVNAVAADARAVCQPNRLRMHEIASAIQQSERLFSPLALATSHELGSDRRSRLHDEIKTLGPMALKNAAMRAAAEGDATLCAVIIGANDALPADQRAFLSADLANQVFGERASNARQHVDHVIGAHTAALALEQALVREPNESLNKIERGYKARLDNADELAAARRAALVQPKSEE